MKELLAELYNKVVFFFQNEKGDNSKDVASNRLKLVLMHDRTKLDPLTLEKMRHEIIDVISRYVVIDKELLELNLAGEGNSIALMLNIPVVRAKTEEELELEAQEAAEEEANEEEETVSEDVEDELDEALDSEDMEYEQQEASEEEPKVEELIKEDSQDELDEALDSEDKEVEEKTEASQQPKKDKKDK